MNTEESPPGNGKGGLPAADPETAKANDVGQLVNAPAIIGKQSDPQGDVFGLFEAVFGPSFGGLLSAPPADDSLDATKAEPTNGNGSEPELDHVQVRSLDSIKPAPENDNVYNPIAWDDPDINELAKSIKEHGLQEPILISRDDFIISGHRRRMAAQIAKLDLVPVRVHPVSRSENRSEFLKLLVEMNSQRIKSVSEFMHESLIKIDPKEAHQKIVNDRKQKDKERGIENLSAIDPGYDGRRCKISPAKNRSLMRSCACWMNRANIGRSLTGRFTIDYLAPMHRLHTLRSQTRSSLSCPEHGIHDPWMPRTTRGLAIAGFTDHDIFNLLREATRNARRTVPDNEIRDTIATIRGTSRAGLDFSSKTPVAYEPAYLEERAARISDTVDEAYLEARSQFTCWNRAPAGFLHKIWRPGESGWITINDKSSDGLIWTHDGPVQRFDELDHVATGQHGVWFLTNPIDAELHALDRRQSARNPEGLTFRAIECVTDWRYMLIESDEAPADLWLKVVVQFELPIVAIYHSGKRGHHVLARLDAKSKSHWDELCEQRRESLIRLGADPAAMTALRLSRLPNCVRGETGLLQHLLYLSPDADSTPICKRPPREPADALEKRIRDTSAGVIHNYETADL